MRLSAWSSLPHQPVLVDTSQSCMGHASRPRVAGFIRRSGRPPAPLTRCRKGVGWLVASAAASGGQPPMVLPFVHSGMEDVLPKGRSLPKLGERGPGARDAIAAAHECAAPSSAAACAAAVARGEREGQSVLRSVQA